MALAVAVVACMESPVGAPAFSAPEACGIAPTPPPEPRTSPSGRHENDAARVRRGENQNTRRTLYLGSRRSTTTIYSVQPVDLSRTDCRQFALTLPRNGVWKGGDQAAKRSAVTRT